MKWYWRTSLKTCLNDARLSASPNRWILWLTLLRNVAAHVSILNVRLNDQLFCNASRYFNPEPVLNSTTVSVGLMNPDSDSF